MACLSCNSRIADLTDQYTLISRVCKNPITMQMISSHLRLTVDETDYDFYDNMTLAIIGFIQKFIKKDFFETTYELTTNNFSCEKTLKRSPYSSIVSFKYLKSGVWTDVDVATYKVVTSNSYSRIVFLTGQNFPDDYDDEEQNTKIQFITKMFDLASDVDHELITAILMIIASLSQYRGDCIESFNVEKFDIYSNIPPQAQLLLRQYRIESVY